MKSNPRKMRFSQDFRFLVGACVLVIALVGLANLANSRDNSDTSAGRDRPLSKQLAQSLAHDNDFREVLANSPGCASEIAAMIIAQAALDQAQAEWDIAYAALEDCILALPDPMPDPDPLPDPDPDPDPLPDPDPMPDPEPVPYTPPDVRPNNGEYSVLVR